MVKFVIQFHDPADLDRFEDSYNQFLAAIEQMPLIRRRQVNAVLGSPMGQTNLYRVLEVYFDDYDHLNEALNSPAGQAAGGKLAQFETGAVDMYFAEVFEESGARTEQTEVSS